MDTSMRWGCMDCGALRGEPGTCPVCRGDGALLDLADAEVRATLIENDDEKARKYERKLLGAGMGMALVSIVAAMAVSDIIAMAMMQVFFLPLIVSCILIAFAFSQIVMRLRPAKRLFPTLQR